MGVAVAKVWIQTDLPDHIVHQFDLFFAFPDLVNLLSCQD